MELVRRLVSQGRVISTEEINRQRRHTSYNGFNLELATRMVPALRREGCLHAPHRQPRHGTPQTGRRWRRHERVRDFTAPLMTNIPPLV